MESTNVTIGQNRHASNFLVLAMIHHHWKQPSKARGWLKRARRVLAEFGARHERQFAHLWEFVAWAEDNALELDLRTPPQRYDN